VVGSGLGLDRADGLNAVVLLVRANWWSSWGATRSPRIFDCPLGQSPGRARESRGVRIRPVRTLVPQPGPVERQDGPRRADCNSSDPEA